MTYTILWGNGPETDYSRRLAQYNPNLKEKLGVRQDTPRQAQKEDKATVKEIAEAFSAVIGQEICEEENTGPTLNRNNRVQRNFNQSGSGNFNRER